MSIQIKSVVVYARDGATRTVEFKPSSVNIITGRSLTGKSAIIEIVDYCLGRSTFTVPEGVIRESVGWYAVVFRLDDGSEMLVAKPAPASLATSQSRCHFEIASQIKLPEMASLEATSNDAAVSAALSKSAGITPNLHVPPPTSSRHEVEADIRHTTYYLFQDQGLVASKDFLFHRQGEEYIPQAIKDTLPYFLGAVNPERLRLEHDLRLANRRLKLAQRDLQESQEISVERLMRGQSLITEAQQAGILPDNVPSDSPEEIMSALEQALSWAPSLTPPKANDKVPQLRSEVDERREKFREIQGQIEAAEIFERESGRYATEAGEQRNRLESIGLFQDIEGPARCPVCSSALASEFPSVAALSESLVRLDSDLSLVEWERPRLREYIDGLKKDRELARQKTAESEFALEAAVSEEEAADELRNANARAARVAGRVSLYLETVQAFDENSELRGAVERAEREVARLELLLSEDAEQEALDSALSRISASMTRAAKDLQLEFQDWPYRLDIGRLTVMADRPGRAIPMQRMGGGKNWLGCHLIALLSLHQLFIQENRPVPRFIILDQPTQVYFLSLQDYANLSGTTEETVSAGGDLDAVRRMFALLFQLCKSLAPKFQIIVLEHANLPDAEFQEALVEEPWSGSGNHALIPQSWL